MIHHPPQNIDDLSGRTQVFMWYLTLHPGATTVEIGQASHFHPDVVDDVLHIALGKGLVAVTGEHPHRWSVTDGGLVFLG